MTQILMEWLIDFGIFSNTVWGCRKSIGNFKSAVKMHVKYAVAHFFPLMSPNKKREGTKKTAHTLNNRELKLNSTLKILSCIVYESTHAHVVAWITHTHTHKIDTSMPLSIPFFFLVSQKTTTTIERMVA